MKNKPISPRQITVNRHVGVFGITQSGKTTWCHQNYMQHNGYGIFINWQHLPLEKYPIFDVKTIPKSLNEKKKIIYNPEDEEDIEEFAEYLLINNRKRKLPSIIVYADEIDQYCAKQSYVEQLITKGQRYGICVVAISQRPQMLSNRTIIENMNGGMVLFNHSVSFYNSMYKIGYKVPDRIRKFLSEESDKPIQQRNRIRAVYYDYVRWWIL